MGQRRLPSLTLLPYSPNAVSATAKDMSPGSASSSGRHAHNAVPKGCLAVKVGQEGEEQQRFVVPVSYFNHPLFMRLLKVAEDEYGFDQQGPITLPCHIAEFRNIGGLIDRDNSFMGGENRPRHQGHQLVGCFKA